MKMTVITGRGGAIIGTARQTADEGRTPAGSGGVLDIMYAKAPYTGYNARCTFIPRCRSLFRR